MSDIIGTLGLLASGGLIGWQAKAASDQIRESLANRARRAEAAASVPVMPGRLVGICGNQAPMLSPSAEQAFCTLPAKHDGWHHDGNMGADWSGAA
jgi:hypothetical protein